MPPTPQPIDASRIDPPLDDDVLLDDVEEDEEDALVDEEPLEEDDVLEEDELLVDEDEALVDEDDALLDDDDDDALLDEDETLVVTTLLDAVVLLVEVVAGAPPALPTPALDVEPSPPLGASIMVEPQPAAASSAHARLVGRTGDIMRSAFVARAIARSGKISRRRARS